MAIDRPNNDIIQRRAEKLDTIAAVLPMERHDELAELLTDQDVETLRRLVGTKSSLDFLKTELKKPFCPVGSSGSAGRYLP